MSFFANFAVVEDSQRLTVRVIRRERKNMEIEFTLKTACACQGDSATSNRYS